MHHYLDELVQQHQRILLLQGPIGDFFQQLGNWLEKQEKIIFKINFNAGDEYFYPKTGNPYNPLTYRHELSQFRGFLADFIQQNAIDAIVCFGDAREYHRIAKQVAEQNKISFWAFEEGYFRPHFVTLEKDGVNAYSTLSRDPEFFRQFANLSEPDDIQPLAAGFLPLAKLAMRYYYTAYYHRHRYPHYQHHRILNVLHYCKIWTISSFKRLVYWIRDYNFEKKVVSGHFGDFFIVPLQVHNDSQVKVHCDFDSVKDFLVHVLDSFVNDAPSHLTLIVKHHPMDRGFIDYGNIIHDYIQRYPQLKGRLYYVHDVGLPVFLRHGKGMVTLNSTSGISALLHNMPTLTLGRASYHMPKLTYQGALAEFWHNPTPPDAEVFKWYRLFHLHKTQLNGSFYKEVVLRYPYNQNEKS